MNANSELGGITSPNFEVLFFVLYLLTKNISRCLTFLKIFPCVEKSNFGLKDVSAFVVLCIEHFGRNGYFFENKPLTRTETSKTKKGGLGKHKLRTERTCGSKSEVQSSRDEKMNSVFLVVSSDCTHLRLVSCGSHAEEIASAHDVEIRVVVRSHVQTYSNPPSPTSSCGSKSCTEHRPE